MVSTLNFNVLKHAWIKLVQNNISSIIKVAPGFENPQNIFLKNINDSNDSLEVKFGGFENAVSDTRDVQSAKRVIVDWLKKISVSVQIIPSTPTELSVKISKDLKFSETRQVVDTCTEKVKNKTVEVNNNKKLVNIIRSNFE